MDDRPFYELDDEELILAEATEAALSIPAAPKSALVATAAPPGLVLRSTLDQAGLERLEAHAAATPVFTILDHAQLVNVLTCTLDRAGDDRFGLAALLRHENGLLQLDRVAPGDVPRSMNGVRSEDCIDILCRATPSDRSTPLGLARRLSASELLALAPLADEHNRFLALRRLGLTLLPNLTRLDITADMLKEYAFALRIFINALAARWTLLPWAELRRYDADDADAAARALLKTLRHELDER